MISTKRQVHDQQSPAHGASHRFEVVEDFIGGYGLWIDAGGKLNHTYSFLGVETYKTVSDAPVPTGKVKLKMLFESDEPKPGSGGIVTLWAGDDLIGEGKIAHTVPIAFTSYSGMDIGRDNGLVVDLAYERKAPYAFTGTIKNIVFDLKPMTVDEAKALHKHEHHHSVGQGVAG